MTAKQKAARRRYQREYMRRYYDANHASLGLSRKGRPAKVTVRVKHV